MSKADGASAGATVWGLPVGGGGALNGAAKEGGAGSRSAERDLGFSV